MAPTCNNCNDVHSFQNRKHCLRASDNNNLLKKPRHTPASRKEATRRERIRVQEIRLAYRSLQTVLNIPTHGRPRYLYILQTAIAYIKFLESRIGLSSIEERNSCDVGNPRVHCIGSNSSSNSDEEISRALEPTDEKTYTDTMFVDSQFDFTSSDDVIGDTSSLDLSTDRDVFNTDEATEIPSPVDELQIFKTLLFSPSVEQQNIDNHDIIEEIGNELNNKHVYCDL